MIFHSSQRLNCSTRARVHQRLFSACLAFLIASGVLGAESPGDIPSEEILRRSDPARGLQWPPKQSSTNGAAEIESKPAEYPAQKREDSGVVRSLQIVVERYKRTFGTSVVDHFDADKNSIIDRDEFLELRRAVSKAEYRRAKASPKASDTLPGTTSSIEAILRARQNQPPTSADLKAIGSGDKALLIAELAKRELTNKVLIVWCLAHLGGADALEALRKILEREYHGRALESEEQSAMLNVTWAIGCMAQHYEPAYDYLVSLTSPENWRTRSGWKNKPPMTTPPEIDFTGHAIVALGLSGSERAMSDIAKAMDANKENLAVLASAFVDAVFYLWYINEYDKERLFKACLNEVHIDDFESFAKSQIGRAWCEWAARARQKSKMRE